MKGQEATRERLRLRWLAAAVALLLAAGCGGGGSGGSSHDETSNGSAAGRVAVFLTDGGAAALAKVPSVPEAATSPAPPSKVLVTIERVELLGGSTVTLYDGPARCVDLLDLRAASVLLCLGDVPAGTYEKIRLTATKIELVDAAGVVREVDPLANGKIDLNPKGPFTVGPGETVVVALDAQDSLHVVETGNGKIQFRPEVFVWVRAVPLPWREGKLVRLQGTVVALSDGTEPSGRWLLLDPPDAASTRTGGGGTTACLIKVDLGPEASFFDDQELEIAFGDLAVGDDVTAVGRFLPTAGEGDSLLPAFEGDVVERGTFVRLVGTVLTSPSPAPGTFLLRLDPGQGFRGDLVVDVHVFEGTKVFWPDGEPATLGDLAVWPDLPPVRARLDAVLDLADGRPDVAHAPLIVIEERPGPVVRATGTVVAFDDATGSLVVLVPPAVEGGEPGEVAFAVVGGTHLYRFVAGTALVVAPRADLVLGAPVLVFGRRGAAGVLEADDVFFLEPPA